MKKLERVMAILLAVIITVCGLPLSSASAAWEDPATTQTPAMRLDCKSFNSTTGILTMTLKVRTSEKGEKNEATGDYKGRFVSDGYLAFQIDSSTLVPVLYDETTEIKMSNKVAYVGSPSAVSALGFLNASTGVGFQIGTEDFQKDLMNISGEARFSRKYSGMLVSSERAMRDNVYDCYVQFEVEPESVILPDEDGYTSVLDLKFRCTSDGQAAQTDKVLFAGSIRVPSAVGSDSSAVGYVSEETLLKQFPATSGSSPASMVKGAAGFSEKDREPLFPGSEEYTFYTNWSYYYYHKPTPNGWTEDFSYGGMFEITETEIAGTPDVSYPNDTVQYILESFSASITNTVETDATVNDQDFPVPPHENRMPTVNTVRYKIPTVEEADAFQTGESAWIPQRYIGKNVTDTREDKQIPLSYNIASHVSKASLTQPEYEDLDAFLESVHWDFLMADGVTPMNDLLVTYDDDDDDATPEVYRDITLQGSPVTLCGGKYKVQKAKIKGNTYSNAGTLIDIVTETLSSGTRTYAAPVGVLLDYSGAQVTYRVRGGTTQTGKKYAPQLWIRPDAANSDSLLWDQKYTGYDGTNSGSSFYLQAFYEIDANTEVASGTKLRVKIYSEVPFADKVKADKIDMVLESADVYTLSLPKDAGLENEEGVIPETNDVLGELGNGIMMIFSVRDQYDHSFATTVNGSLKRPTITIEPTEAQAARIQAAGKVLDPFTVEAVRDTVDAAGWPTITSKETTEDGGYVYALRYNTYKNSDNQNVRCTVNDVFPGEYVITATYEDSSATPWTAKIHVEKSDDVFNYLGTKLNTSIAAEPGAGADVEDEEGMTTVILMVPQLDADRKQVAATASLTFTDLANSWRVPGTSQDPKRYDMFPDLRNNRGQIVNEKVAEHFTVHFTLTDASGNEITTAKDDKNRDLQDISGIDESAANFLLTYYSAMPDNTVMYLTVTAQCGSIQRSNQYKLVFKRYERKVSVIYVGTGASIKNDPMEKQLPSSDFVKEVGATKGQDYIDIQARAEDQYGDGYDWDELKKKYNTTTDYTIELWENGKKVADPNAALASKGITFSDAFTGSGRNNRVTVTYQTTPTELSIRANFMDVRSLEVPLTLYRDLSVPQDISVLDYDYWETLVPGASETDPVELTPAIEVKDQYGQVIDPSNYKVAWFYTPEQDANRVLNSSSLISLDPDTGKITVQPCAEDVPYDFTVTARVSMTVAGKTLTKEKATAKALKIYRHNPPSVSAIKINESSFNYPENAYTTYTLTASMQNEYTDPSSDQWEEITNASDVTWTLTEVVLGSDPDGPGGSDPVITATHTDSNITRNVSTGEYRDADNAMRLNGNTGEVKFDATDGEKAVLSFKVTAMYQNDSRKSDSKTITIVRAAPDPNKITVTIDLTLYPDNEDLDVPSTGNTDSIKLFAYVRDQFTFRMKDAEQQVVWNITETPVSSSDPSDPLDYSPEYDPTKDIWIEDGQLYINHKVPSGTIKLTASYNGKTSSEVEVGVSREAGTPETIAITGTYDNIVMPALNASGTLFRSTDFAITKSVRDQRDVSMRDAQVTKAGGRIEYAVTEDTYGLASVSTTGRVTITSNKTWQDDYADYVAGDSSKSGATAPTIKVQVTLTKADGTTTVTDDKVITLQVDPIPAWAEPARTGNVAGTDYTASPSVPTYVLVPSRRDAVLNKDDAHGGWTFVNYTAKVYSQYGVEMPGEQATITFASSVSQADRDAMRLIDKNDGTVCVEIGPDMNNKKTYITAVPKNVGAFEEPYVIAKSTFTENLDRGPSYAESITLYNVSDGSTSTIVNPNTVSVGGWGISVDTNVPPAPETIDMTTVVSFRAQILDQGDSNFLGNVAAGGGDYYLIWEFVGDHTGVDFKDPADANGHNVGTPNASGTDRKYDQIDLEIDGFTALGQDEDYKDITLNCYMGNGSDVYAPDGDTENLYHISVTFRLEKSPSEPTYLFFENVEEDNDGLPVLNTTWMRPTLAEGSATYELNSVMYDQYGHLVENVPVVLRPITWDGYAVERVYADGVDPEKTPNAIPEKYLIIQGGNTVAEGGEAVCEVIPSTATGQPAQVTVLTACKFPEVCFAVSRNVGDRPKYLYVSIDTDGPNGLMPNSMAIQLLDENGEPMEDGKVSFKEEDEEPFDFTVSLSILDQFGDPYTGSLGTPTWPANFNMKDEDGNYTVPYEELDEEGEPKEPTVTWQIDSTGRNLTFTVYPDRYQDPVSLLLTCELQRVAGGLWSEQPGWSGQEDLVLEVTRSKTYTPGALVPTTTYAVNYLPGEHGKLEGSTAEAVKAGEHAAAVPKVIPQEGWGVAGWVTAQGVKVSSPTELEIWEDTTFTVEYMEVSKRAFLNGYDDHTVRPNQAVTRGEFTKMLILAVTDFDGKEVFSHPFTDVDHSRYYDKYIGYAFKLGIVSGYGDNTFHPNDTITRAEAAKMVAEAAELMGDLPAARAAGFKDVNVETWYAKYINQLAGAEIVNGYSDGTYRPQKTITRAESVKIMVMIMEDAPGKEELDRLKEYSATPFVDLKKGTWSYPYILRAAGVA